MKKPLVTIVMPVYNVAPYIERALLSAIRQTYSNLEIILVDDCGKDDSIPIAERLIAQYDTNRIVRIIHHDNNRGLSAARNTGLDNMRGEYIYFMDSDDEITPDCIEKLEALVEKYPDVEMVIGNMSVPISPNDPEEKKKQGRDFSHFPEYSDDRDWIVKNTFDSSNGYFIPTTSVNKLQKRSFFVRNNLRFLEGIIHEDELMSYDCAECIQSIGFCHDVTYIRYWNENSIMSSLTTTKSIRAWHKIMLRAIPNMKEPYVNLKLASGMVELTRKYLNLPQNAICDIWRTKYVFCKIATKARQCGNMEIVHVCHNLVLLPHRIARLTKIKNHIYEGIIKNLFSMLIISILPPPVVRAYDKIKRVVKCQYGHFRQWIYYTFVRLASMFISKEQLYELKRKHDIRMAYEYTFHRQLNFANPQTLNEKLIWLSYYWRNPLIVQCADKYRVRDYVNDCGLSSLLVPLLGVWKDPEDIDFENMPSSFVLKCNHGCGYNIIVRDKSKIDIVKVKDQLKDWLEITYKGGVAENHYERITPHLIIAEKYLDALAEGKQLIDYKLFCINGEPQFVDVCYDRDEEFEAKHAEYTLKWKQFDCEPANIERPESLDKMIEYARILAKPFPFVRVDFYEIFCKPFLGELTFSPWGNMITVFSDETQNKYGKMLKLPKKRKF